MILKPNFPLFVFLILILESVKEANSLKTKKLKGFFIILFAFCTFCLVRISGTFFGIFSPFKRNIQKSYKHY